MEVKVWLVMKEMPFSWSSLFLTVGSVCLLVMSASAVLSAVTVEIDDTTPAFSVCLAFCVRRSENVLACML